MNIKIVNAGRQRIPRKKISVLTNLIIEEEDPPPAQVNLIFVSDKAMAELNRRYRGIPGPTDVLSFNIDLMPPFKNKSVAGDAILGEIYISADTASRNAARHKCLFTVEIIRLVCHGLLHLLGYDHIKDYDYRRMHSRENYFLGKMGI